MSNADQIEYWNGPVGEKWVRQADRLDAMLEPFAEAVLDAAALDDGDHVFDVGCGAGALTLKAMDRLEGKLNATGLDVSRPLLSLARQRALEHGVSASFEEGDASVYRSERPVDALISRFGVMFFDDPAAAFANLRSNLRPEGRVTFACWQSLRENDWARAPLEAALPFLSEPPAPPPPGAPGPFAFSDKDRVVSILKEAGWQDVSVEPWLGPMTMPGKNVIEAAGFMVELGPVARLVSEAGADLSRVEEALSEGLTAHVNEDGSVSLSAAAWIVSARAA